MKLALHALTILLSAFLLFSVQPMVGKALLPRLGGVPGVWTACLLFFQAALLVGYGYVWLGARAMAARVRVVVHLSLIAAALVLIPPFSGVQPPDALDAASHPVAFALAFLTLEVGLAFTLLSATAPLLQHFYAYTSGRRPYFLYAASNAGSLGALLAYPFLIEPLVDLQGQQAAFRAGFVAVAFGLTLIGVIVFRAGGGPVADAVPAKGRVPGGADGERIADGAVRREGTGAADGPRHDTEGEPAATEAAGADAAADPSWPRRLRWVGLAFVPTALLAGASAHLSLDVAPVPLLWVLPLALYLGSFILAFSERVPAPPPWVGRGACMLAVVLVFVTVTHANEPIWLIATMHLAFLAAGSWMAHRRLADDAPHPRHLPEFFALIALGGVLGTLMTAVIAPAVLPDLWEYPATIAIGCAARRRIGIVRPDRPLRTDLPHIGISAALVVLGGLLAPRLQLEPAELGVLVSFGPAAVYAYRWMPLRRRFSLCLLAVALAGSLTQERGERRLSTRSFFGVLRVVDQGGVRHLLHGTTSHGSQRLDQRDACVPRGYYDPAGPLAGVFDAHRALGRRGRTVAVGLGTGAMSCFARPDEAWRFWEINPDVIEVATDPHWFTYLRQSPSHRVDLALGDGRLGLQQEQDAALAMVVVDAFNSDSVPVHLLTRQALRLYLDKLRPGGWAVLHISNRVLNLPRVVADVVAAEGAAAVLAADEHATVAVVARRAEDLRGLDPALFSELRGGVAERAWTDSFSSLWSAVDLSGE